MKTGFNSPGISTIIGTIFLLTLLFPLTLQRKRERKSVNDADIHKYWAKVAGNIDHVSNSIVREYEIYSHVTGKRVRMRGKKVDAKGKVGSPNVKFRFISRTLGGQIMIQNVANGRYLCMTKKGRLVGKFIKKFKRNASRINYCIFTEQLTELYRDVFHNFARPSWYIAFRRNGKPKRGGKTTPGQDETFFMKIPQNAAAINTISSNPVYKDFAQRLREAFLSEDASRINDVMADAPSIPVPPPPRPQAPKRRRVKKRRQNRARTANKRRRPQNHSDVIEMRGSRARSVPGMVSRGARDPPTLPSMLQARRTTPGRRRRRKKTAQRRRKVAKT